MRREEQAFGELEATGPGASFGDDRFRALLSEQDWAALPPAIPPAARSICNVPGSKDRASLASVTSYPSRTVIRGVATPILPDSPARIGSVKDAFSQGAAGSPVGKGSTPRLSSVTRQFTGGSSCSGSGSWLFIHRRRTLRCQSVAFVKRTPA